MKLQNFKTSKNEYLEKYPQEISIFINQTAGVCKERLDLFYRFIFSEEYTYRKLNYYKKDIPNTKELYLIILKEFLQGRKFFSISYDEIRLDDLYYGFRLINNENNRLNIYFSENIKERYQEFKIKIIQTQQMINKKYLISCIKNNDTDKIVFLTNTKKSGMHHLYNGNQFDLTYQKDKKLGIFYQKAENEKEINKEDYSMTIESIYAFINANITETINYEYNYNGFYKNEKLIIHIGTGKEIRISDYDLIYQLEKGGLIDYLKYLMNSKNDLILKRKK